MRKSEFVLGQCWGANSNGNMAVAELGVVEKQQQESPPPVWPDEDDGTGGEKPISSAPRGRLSGQHVTLSSRAVTVCTVRPAMRTMGGYLRWWLRRGGENMRVRRRVGRVGGLVVRLLRGAWGGAWTAEDALSATRAPTAEREDNRLRQEHVLKKARIAFIIYFVLQIRGLVRFLGI